MNLQGIGKVKSQLAKTVKLGDKLVWNFGCEELVESFEKETAKFITVSVRSLTDGKIYSRRIKKDREVCVA